MQWDSSLPHAGFTQGRTLVARDTTTSVRDQDNEVSSMLSLYRRLQVLRRSHAAPVQGTIENIAAHGDVLT